MQPMFKLPMDPKMATKSSMSSNMMSHMQLSNMMDKNQKSPLMRPDSHGEFCHRQLHYSMSSLAQISWNLISRLTKIITTCLFVAFDWWISVWFRLVFLSNWCLVMHATVFYDFIETPIPTNILEHPDISSPLNKSPMNSMTICI